MKKQRAIPTLAKTMGHFPTLAVAAVANLGEGVCKVLVAAQSGRMVEAIRLGDRDRLIFLAGLLLLCAAGAGVCILAKDTLLGIFLEKGMRNVRRRTVESIGRAKMSWLGSRHSGELTARVSGDLNTLLGSLRPVVIMGVSVFFVQLVATVYLFWQDWLFSLLIFGLVPLVVLFQWGASRAIRGHQQASLEAVADLTKTAADSFDLFETVKSLSLEQEMAGQFAAAQDAQTAAEQKLFRTKARLSPLGQLGQYLPFFVLLGVGGLSVLGGRMSLGVLVVFLSLHGSACRIFGNATQLITAIRRLEACAQRTLELWQMPSEAQDAPPLADNPAAPAVDLSHVGFSYPGSGQAILRDVSLRVERGERVAIVGESGCGKSTLLSLAATLYLPDTGSAALFGGDLRQVEPDSVRRRIGYMSQDPILFDGTILDNVACFAEQPDAGRGEQCLRQAALGEFLDCSPQGINTPVGSRGLTLSGGQRQRIAVARALYKGAPLLLMDEITSALDTATERALLDSLLSLESRPAMVYVTHRLSVLPPFDRIVVMEQGQIVEQGDFETLAAAGGPFARLLRQAEETGEEELSC